MNVLIKRSYDSYQYAVVNTEVLSGIRWDNTSGGIFRHHAGSALYAYIDYELGAELGLCSGRHGFYGNDIKVMIPACQNKAREYARGL